MHPRVHGFGFPRMSRYRRRNQPGGTFFFTVVTHNRRKILTGQESRNYLRTALKITGDERPFESIAMVLLPDHLCCLWRLPPGDGDYSTRWRLIKTRFTRAWLHGREHIPPASKSRGKRGERSVWQRRFWEHQIRDEKDLKRHLDYIHYNPVKHGYVRKAGDWAWSTFDRFVCLGEYQRDWGEAEPGSLRGWDASGE